MDDVVREIERLKIEPIGHGVVLGAAQEGYVPNLTPEIPGTVAVGMRSVRGGRELRRRSASVRGSDHEGGLVELETAVGGAMARTADEVGKEIGEEGVERPLFSQYERVDAPSRGLVQRERPAAQTPDVTDQDLVAWAEGIAARTYFELSHWAKMNDRLQTWQRSMLYDIGLRIAKGIPVSVKQARQAKKAYDWASEAGFKPSS